jgi:ABC-type nitrate/sulfonate/bicarbonate transport system substrate-binding protein
MIKKLNIPAALVVLLSVCWNAPASAQATKVAIGYSGISADQLVIWVAKDTGIFAKNNLDAQLYISRAERCPSPRWFQAIRR